MTTVGLLAQVDWEAAFEGGLRGAIIGGCVGLLAALVIWIGKRGKDKDGKGGKGGKGGGPS
jgi:hypothetical protein